MLAGVQSGFAQSDREESDPSGSDDFGKYEQMSSKATGTPPNGLTDDSILATHPQKPDESLCERGEEGHRRATTYGNELLKMNELQKAEACFLSALKHKNDFPMALYGLGEVHVASSRYTLAVDAYELAVRTWPQYVDAFVALGDVHLKMRKRKKAEKSYQQAVDVGKEDPLAWEALGRFYLHDDVRKYWQAHVTYKRAALAVQNGRSSPGLILGLAEAAKGARKFEDCVAKADRASSLAPRFGNAKFIAGSCRASLGDLTGAIPNFRDAVRIDPEEVKHHISLAKSLVGVKMSEQAREVLMGAVEVFSDASDDDAIVTLSRELEKVKGGDNTKSDL